MAPLLAAGRWSALVVVERRRRTRRRGGREVGKAKEERVGEVASDGFAEILALAEPQPGEAFIDLGSGSGKAVVLAAALHPFSKAVGVEFVRALHLASSRIVAAFRDALPRLPLYSSGRNTPPEIDMVCVWVCGGGVGGLCAGMDT